MSALSNGRFAAILLTALLGSSASAQTVCQFAPTPGQPDRQVLQCGDALQVEGGPNARFAPVSPDAAGVPQAVEVTEGRVLARVRSGAPVSAVSQDKTAPGSFEFQIRTPHAIASVRGTTWAVDVSNGRTTVYVKDGRVRIQRLGDGVAGSMTCNEGIDVSPDDRGPLDPHQWARQRSDAFLAPFGLRGGCPPGERPRDRGDNRPEDADGTPRRPGDRPPA